MSSETEKMLSGAMNVFNTKLCERQLIKLEGMEDYLKVPQYKALVNMEKKASMLETDAASRVLNSRLAYLKAARELKACERRWFEAIRSGMDSLEERDRIVKDVNMKMRKGDYSVLQPAAVASAAPQSSPRAARNHTAADPPFPRRQETARAAPAPSTKKPDLTDIKNKLARLNLDMTPRSPLQSISVNKTAKAVPITTTPKTGPGLSSKGSVDGSLIPNRAPTTPLSHSKWNVPAPNFDETIDTELINPQLRGAPFYRHLPTIHQTSDDEREEAEDTFPLSRPSLPYMTPTVPNSRPFLLSSLRREGGTSSARPNGDLPVRPTPVSASRRSPDPLSNLGLMKLKRPVLNSDVGKKLMGQL